ncbi:MAG: type II toxin-antitoxin system ParD family antitoxin [Longimicrobiales bacterium]|nr:type II toxin-antitoxin system ParD family antitoxin [Longimicrobiales bacterium]
MNVSLTPELERFVTSKVEAGLYGSQSEVVRQGLRLLMERDGLLGARIAELRRDVAVGLEAARRGDLVDGGEVVRRMEARTHAPRRG